jgi:hypothetical protein
MMGLDGDNAETLVAPGLTPRRLPVSASEEMSQGLREVPECLLLNHLATRPQPFGPGPRLGELSALSQVSGHSPTPRTPPRMLLHGKVPHESRVRAVLEQH